MYLFDIKGLNKQLECDGLDQKDEFIYVLLGGLLDAAPTTLMMVRYFQYNYELTIKNWIVFIIGYILLLLGTTYCYKKNKGRDGKDFLDRYISISIVMIFRLLIPFLLIFMSVGYASNYIPKDMAQFKIIIIVLSYGTLFSFALITFWRVGYHLRDVSKKDGNLTTG